MKSRYSYLDIAKEDLVVAETMLKSNNLNYSVRLCQQYVEKLFKEALVRYGATKDDMHLFHTHNLHRLSIKFSEIFDVEFSEMDELYFRRLTDYYFNTNYPGEDYVRVSLEDAEKILERTLQFQSSYEHILADENRGR